MYTESDVTQLQLHKVSVSWFSIFKNWGQDSPQNTIRWTDNNVNQTNTEWGHRNTGTNKAGNPTGHTEAKQL
jgi:hypothetical protein